MYKLDGYVTFLCHVGVLYTKSVNAQLRQTVQNQNKQSLVKVTCQHNYWNLFGLHHRKTMFINYVRVFFMYISEKTFYFFLKLENGYILLSRSL